MVKTVITTVLAMVFFYFFMPWAWSLEAPWGFLSGVGITFVVLLAAFMSMIYNIFDLW